MKILAVSDLHFGLAQFDWVAQQAERFDLVIIAGDLLDVAGHLDLDSQITVVVKYLRTISAKTRLLVCSGNHDGDVKNERDELKDRAARSQAHLEALEEEVRRAARGTAAGGDAELARAQTELRDTRVELKKVEADRTRLGERLQQTEAERATLVERAAELDVEREREQLDIGPIEADHAQGPERAVPGRRGRLRCGDELVDARERAREPRHVGRGTSEDGEADRPVEPGSSELVCCGAERDGLVRPC